MSPVRDETDERTLQQLVTRRFAMASVTYGLALLLTWVAVAGGFYQATISSAVVHSALIVLSQLAFFWLFHRGINLRFKDPSLTEPQVLVALVWLTYFLFNLGSARGSLLVLYLLVLMFAVFLPPKVFVRYATLAFLSFIGLAAMDYYLQRTVDATVFLLQACVLLVTLIWMCLL
ncbi:MAG TPA: hypothetical protein DCX26_05890, partial [Pseudomonas sp.]|nr:hypothetical protein [Pseudomonas sp.]